MFSSILPVLLSLADSFGFLSYLPYPSRLLLLFNQFAVKDFYSLFNSNTFSFREAKNFIPKDLWISTVVLFFIIRTLFFSFRIFLFFFSSLFLPVTLFLYGCCYYYYYCYDYLTLNNFHLNFSFYFVFLSHDILTHSSKTTNLSTNIDVNHLINNGILFIGFILSQQLTWLSCTPSDVSINRSFVERYLVSWFFSLSRPLTSEQQNA